MRLRINAFRLEPIYTPVLLAGLSVLLPQTAYSDPASGLSAEYEVVVLPEIETPEGTRTETVLAVDLNDHGDVLVSGRLRDANNETLGIRVWLWRQDTGQWGELESLPPVPGKLGRSSIASRLNNHGVAVGQSDRHGDQYLEAEVAVQWLRPDGGVETLGSLPTDKQRTNSIARDINDTGLVVGVDGHSVLRADETAVVWRPGETMARPLRHTYAHGKEELEFENTTADAVNAAGYIAGSATIRRTDSTPPGRYAVLWNPDSTVHKVLKRHHPAARSIQHYIAGVNDQRVVIGSFLYQLGPHHESAQFLWDTANDLVIELQPIGQSRPSPDLAEVIDINNRGVAVGHSTDWANAESTLATAWDAETHEPVALADLIDPSRRLDPYTAVAINNMGSILVNAIDSVSLRSRVVVLRPKTQGQHVDD